MQDSSIDHLAHAYEDVADLYEAGRPSYSSEAVAVLAAELGIRAGRTVLDVGAGTGKLTRLLVSTGARVLAAEPISAMCRVLEQTAPDAAVVRAAAAGLPFRDGSIDVVTAAQAFQWFGRTQEVSELRRILRPGGGIGLLWNRRDRSLPVWQEIESLIGPYRPERPADQAWRAGLVVAGFGALHQTTIPFDHHASPEQIQMRVASMSWVAALPEATRAPLLVRIREIAAGHTEDGTVALRENTDVVWARRP